MSIPLFFPKRRWDCFLCQAFLLIVLSFPATVTAQHQGLDSNSLFGNQSANSDVRNQFNGIETRNVGFRRNEDKNVTIPMSTYQDLLNRVDTLESRADATDRRQVQNGWDLSSSTTNETDEGRGGFYGKYEIVFAKPVYSNNTAFYTHDNIASVNEGAILHEFNWDLDDSHRFEIGYLNPSTNLGWRTRIWFFDTNAQEVSAADVDVKVGVADDPDIAIDDVSSSDDDFLIATASTNMDVIDVERMSQRGSYDDNLTFSGGLRYSKINHSYAGVTINPGNPIGNQLRTRHIFEGAGPTFAINKRRNLQDTNFALEFGGRGSLIFGSGDASWVRIGLGGTSDAILHPGEMRIVPVVEVNMGVAYRRRFGRNGRLELGTGFEGQLWMNGGTPLSAGQDGNTDSDNITSPWTEDLGFLGTYFRGTINY